MSVSRFAGLDGLRFISILFVVLHHLFTFQRYFGYNVDEHFSIGLIGLYGIHFFFMGSGFLITYLLLSERQKTGSFSLKYFFMRRILRIWPAYYLLICISLLILLKHPFFRIPGLTDDYVSGNYKGSNTFFLFFLPHIAPFHNSTAPFVHHTYTIGIEEQFYILWGLLFFFFYKYIYWILIIMLAIFPFLNFLHQELFIYTSTTNDVPLIIIFVKKALYYLKYSKISTFIIGSLFGYAYFFKKKWILLLKSWWIQIAIYITFFLSIFLQVEIPYVHFEYKAFIMGLIMLIATFKEESIFNYSAPWIEFLGKVSYGIYLYHIFAIFFALKLFNCLNIKLDSIWQVLLLILITITISIFFGILSYRYFEMPFLKLKYKFRRVEISHT